MKLSPARLATIGATALLLAGLTACGAPAPAETVDPNAGTYAVDENTLVFVVLPDHEGSDQDAQPIADYIAEITGKEVQFFEATDYTAAVQALASGQADIGQISAFTYFQAQQAGAEIEPIGAQITKEGAEPGYFSVAIKNPASDAASLEDYADQPVCFVNSESTSGFLIPTSVLKTAGVEVTPENTVFGEKHPATAALVAEGARCQVGFAQDVDVDPLIASGQLEEIDRFQVPAAPIVMQTALPQSVKDALVAGLADSTQASLTDAGIELNEFLTTNWFGFGAVDDAYYDTIRELCTNLPDVESCKG